jgi:peptide chain release factor 2
VITFDPDALSARRAELEQQMGEPGFWDDQETAARISTEHARVSRRLERYEQLIREYDDARELHALDGGMEAEIVQSLEPLQRELDRLEEDALFTGEYDAGDAVVTIHSGAGGTDSQDWAEMLLRMYLRWAESRGFDVELDEVQGGTEAGITSATFIVKGRYAYGLLRGEKGVHRLIRISPFDANARRHTAFASFDAVPALDHAEEPEIDPSELRIDTYRSSGAGGQHVNVTDSAVRITHVPTGIVVSVQNERSQIQNRAKAMQILAARLAERQRVERQQELEALSGEKREVAFGNQIRTYTLAPFQLVKDERTRYETGNVRAVLDGELDSFIEEYLQWHRQQNGSAPSVPPSGPAC